MAAVPKLSNKAAKARAKDISQSLSMLLRHNAREKGISIDQQGWVLMGDALQFINDVDDDDPWEGGPVTLDEVLAVVTNSDKQRFAIWERPPLMIRASQGHSMEGIVPDLDPVNLDEVRLALHGTYSEAWDAIKTKGLNKMSRNHIHLAKALPGESGVISGMRAGCQVLIWVDLVKASAAGIVFMQSANGVILSEGKDGIINPEYFSHVVDRKTGIALQ
jgi:2'-phosphotransferase